MRHPTSLQFIRVLDARRGLIIRVTTPCSGGGGRRRRLAHPLQLGHRDAGSAQEQHHRPFRRVSPLTTDPATVQNQIQIITSREMAGRCRGPAELQATIPSSIPTCLSEPGRLCWAIWPRLRPPQNWFASKRTRIARAATRTRDRQFAPPCLGRCPGAFHHHRHFRQLSRCGEGRHHRQCSGRCLCEEPDRQQDRRHQRHHRLAEPADFGPGAAAPGPAGRDPAL